MRVVQSHAHCIAAIFKRQHIFAACCEQALIAVNQRAQQHLPPVCADCVQASFSFGAIDDNLARALGRFGIKACQLSCIARTGVESGKFVVEDRQLEIAKRHFGGRAIGLSRC